MTDEQGTFHQHGETPRLQSQPSFTYRDRTVASRSAMYYQLASISSLLRSNQFQSNVTFLTHYSRVHTGPFSLNLMIRLSISHNLKARKDCRNSRIRKKNPARVTRRCSTTLAALVLGVPNKADTKADLACTGLVMSPYRYAQTPRFSFTSYPRLWFKAQSGGASDLKAPLVGPEGAVL